MPRSRSSERLRDGNTGAGIGGTSGIGETIILRTLTGLYCIARGPVPRYYGCRVVTDDVKPNWHIARSLSIVVGDGKGSKA